MRKAGRSWLAAKRKRLKEVDADSPEILPELGDRAKASQALEIMVKKLVTQHSQIGQAIKRRAGQRI